MGDSLQAYRSRIGTFSHKPVTENVRKSYKPSYNYDYKYPLLPIFLFLLLNLVLIVTNLNKPVYPSFQSKGVYSSKIRHTYQLTWSTSRTSILTSTGTSSSSSTTSSLRDPVYLCSYWLTSKDRNHYAQIIFGNRSQRGHGMKLLHWNKGSSYLQNKHHEVETIIEAHTPHVLGLSEANLKADHDLARVQHPEYELHTCSTMSNPELSVSRIVVYTHNSLVVKRRFDLEDNKISAIWLEAGLPRQKKILICQAYREWKYLDQGNDISNTIDSQLERWLIFLDRWEQALMEGKEVIVMKDANLDLLKWTKSDLPSNDSTKRLQPLIESLFRRIFPLGVAQLVDVPTRAWPGQPESGLDHIYSNRREKLSDVYTESAGGSDHKLIKITRFSKSLKRNVRYVRKRMYKNFMDEKFCQEVRELRFWDIFACENPSWAAQMLTYKMSNILDKMAPVRTVQVRTKYAAWLSSDTKKLLKVRNEAHEKAMKTKHQDDWRNYKNLRNTATAKMKLEKRAWEKHKLDNSEQNSSILWKNVKGWLNWGKSGPPTQLFHEGKVVNSPADIAGTMNSFFTNKVNKLRSTISPAITDPLAKLRESLLNRDCSLRFHAVSPDEVLKAIRKLKNSKATGVDHIDTRIVKLVAEDILPALTHIINLSITKSEFPCSWKHAKVIPLLKKGDTLNPKNYRPVALLPIFSKVLERIVFNQMVKYLDENQLLNPNHHGSRHSHSTTTALLQMYDQWVEEAEEGYLVGVMMIDLSAAFDMVDHPLLLQKLELLGLEQSAIDWFQSYLSHRTQSVFVDGYLSPPLDLICGVPQGSILGPLMYIIFTNDMPDLVHSHEVDYKDPKPHCRECGSTVCYVDDATFSFGNSDPEVVTQTLNTQYRNIAKYMNSNKLVINDEKTQLVVMSNKATANRRSEVTLTAGQHLIERTASAKLLGGLISEDLKWKVNLLTGKDSIIKQLRSRVNGLSLISSRATFGTRLMVANGLVVSKICYLIQLWGGCDNYLLQPLQVLINKAARIVTGCNRYTSTKRLMNKCKWLSIKQMIFYQTVAMAHKTKVNKSPIYMYRKFSSVYPYSTRQADGGCIRLGLEFTSKKSICHDSYRYRAASNYNSIPSEIRLSRNVGIFKHKLKKWVISNIPVD